MPAAPRAAGISIFLQDDFIFEKGTLCFLDVWAIGYSTRYSNPINSKIFS